jgi:hypothetical protein
MSASCESDAVIPIATGSTAVMVQSMLLLVYAQKGNRNAMFYPPFCKASQEVTAETSVSCLTARVYAADAIAVWYGSKNSRHRCWQWIAHALAQIFDVFVRARHLGGWC